MYNFKHLIFWGGVGKIIKPLHHINNKKSRLSLSLLTKIYKNKIRRGTQMKRFTFVQTVINPQVKKGKGEKY